MISIIIPTFNEEGQIGALVQHLSRHDAEVEIIVADGGSTDATVTQAEAAGARVISCARKGRAAQMNQGAAAARGEVLYFLHADSYPPQHFHSDILQALAQGCDSGCYRLRFDHPHWFLRANCWFTRFNLNAVRFGDQSLFVTTDVFYRAGGFREDLVVMEDQEVVGRIRKHGRFKVLKGDVTTSARKYIDNGIYRMQAIFVLIYTMYWLGFSQTRLVRTYRSLIRQDKV